MMVTKATKDVAIGFQSDSASGKISLVLHPSLKKQSQRQKKAVKKQKIHKNPREYAIKCRNCRTYPGFLREL